MAGAKCEEDTSLMIYYFKLYAMPFHFRWNGIFLFLLFLRSDAGHGFL